MLQVSQITTILLCLFIVTASCNKDKVKVTTSTTEVSLKKNDIYQLDLGSSCDECGLSISRQAKQYLISEISIDTARQGLNFVYRYKPLFNYTGLDEVEIKRSSGSNGSSPNNIIHLNTIKFTITN
jgi:hypothetical protein